MKNMKTLLALAFGLTLSGCPFDKTSLNQTSFDPCNPGDMGGGGPIIMSSLECIRDMGTSANQDMTGTAPADMTPGKSPDMPGYVAACGNGYVDSGEGCDDGNTKAGDGCDASCKLEHYCGDGAVDVGEQCDDGNNMDGDYCSATCEWEPNHP